MLSILYYCFNLLCLRINLYSRELANSTLTKVGHYFLQSKCVEIILNYSGSTEIIRKIFARSLLRNSLKVVGDCGFNKSPLNTVIICAFSYEI